jgi:thioesterase domain-containing protein
MLHTRLEEMAAYHVGRIRQLRSEGPYLVGGMCAGGVIAFEIARQLQALGENVAMVALIDAADVTAALRPMRFARSRLASFRSGVAGPNGAKGVKRALSITGKALRKASNLSRYLVGTRVRKLADGTRLKLLRLYLARGQDLPRFLHDISVRTVYLFAEQAYRPDTPFDGELALFRATSGAGDDEPYVERYVDPLFGWARRATRGVRAYDVPGGHSSMLQEPNARVLARLMQAHIDDVLASPRALPNLEDLDARLCVPGDLVR